MQSLQTSVYRPTDWNIQATVSGNPFDVKLAATVQGPGHVSMTIPGFYKGNGTWCIRFSPPAPGAWRLQTMASEAALAGHSAVVEAEANTNPKVHGVVRVDKANPYHFRYDDGTPYFLFGYEINWLWALDQNEAELRRMNRLLDMVGDAGFNHIMVNSYAHDTSWCPGKSRENDYGPAQIIPWEGTAEAPVHARLNTAYFDHYDRMMWALWERGMIAHIYMKVYNKRVRWPAKRSPEEDLFFDYFVARYQAFPNLVWDFSKECYNEPDKDYVAERLSRIREQDAYKHLTTVHDDWYFAYNEPYRQTVDFITDQNHHEFHYTVLEQRWRKLGPVLNAEYGYEHGPGGLSDFTYDVVQPPLTVLTRTYDVLMAGGYPTYYYTNHAWDVIEWDEVPAGLPAYKHLHAFFTSFDWYKMVPRPELGQGGGMRCLTNESDEIVLFSLYGRGHLVPLEKWNGTNWQGYWMNIWTGERQEVRLEKLLTGKRHTVQAPWEKMPAVLYLRLVD